VWRCLRDPTFSSFDTIPVCERQTDDGQTDRQTHDDSIYTPSIASRGKTGTALACYDLCWHQPIWIFLDRLQQWNCGFKSLISRTGVLYACLTSVPRFGSHVLYVSQQDNDPTCTALARQSSCASGNTRIHLAISVATKQSRLVLGWLTITEYGDWCRSVCMQDISQWHQRLEAASYWHLGKHPTRRRRHSRWPMENTIGCRQKCKMLSFSTSATTNWCFSEPPTVSGRKRIMPLLHTYISRAKILWNVDIYK